MTGTDWQDYPSISGALASDDTLLALQKSDTSANASGTVHQVPAGSLPYAPVVNAVAWGADPTGGSDTWTALQTALLSFGTLTSWGEGNGGIVDLGEGFFTISKPLVVPSGVKLRGVGPGGTLLRVITGSNCDVIQAAQYNSSAQATLLGGLVPGLTASAIWNAFYWSVESMYLHGEAFSSPAAGYYHGINNTVYPATSAAPNDPDFDPAPVFRDLIITGMTGDGIYHLGRSGALIERVLSQYHNGNGFSPSFDTTLLDCLANQCGIAGFYNNHSSVTAAGCKSYNNQDQTWVSGNAYSPGNVCVSSGSMYFCISSVSGSTAPASDPTHWSVLTGATSPQAAGYGYYWDTGCGEHTWSGVDAQENSKGDYYFRGANTGGIGVHGSSANVNYNNGNPSHNSSNPNHYASVTFDGCSGVTAIINSSQQASGDGVICTSLNSPGSNTLIATTDLTETALFNGGIPTFALVNGVVQGPLTIGSGLADAEQFVALTTPYTLSSGTGLQKLFNATSTGALTVAGSTSYFFECEFDLTLAASGAISFGFGGTATLTSVKYTAMTQKTSTVTTPTTPFIVEGTAAAAQLLVATTSAGTNATARIRGIVRINAAGTLIPEVALGVSTTTAVVGTNSFFRCWPVGSNTVTDVGSWS